MWLQRLIQLKNRERGFHLITDEIQSVLPELTKVRCGILHLFMQHTSASLALNENADASVRRDFRRFVDRLVPENEPYYEHRDEGPDDMPAHLKASIVGGASLSLPVSDGRLALGTWQGIYLCEYRNHGGARRLLATLNGETTGS